MHCGATEYKTTKEWTTEEALEVFEDLLSHNFNLFDFLGGEPFIREDILELFTYLNENKAWIMMSTNGLLLNEEIIDGLVNLKYLNGVFFSIDGASKEIYETIRGKGNYERMLVNLKALISKKKETKSQFRVGLTCVINNLNASETNALVELADQFDLDSVSMINIGWIGNAKKNKEKLYIEPQIEFAAYDRAFRKVSSTNRIRKLQGKRPLSFSIDSVPSTWKYYFIQKYPLFSQSQGKYQCLAGEETFFVDSSGVLYPCEAVRIHMKSIESEIGKYKKMSMPEHTFKEIVNNNMFKKTVEYIKNKEYLLKDVTPCSSCPHSDGCGICPLYARSEKTIAWCSDLIKVMAIQKAGHRAF